MPRARAIPGIDSGTPSTESPTNSQQVKEDELKSMQQLKGAITASLATAKLQEKTIAKSERYMRQKLNQQRKMATKELSCIKPEQRRATANFSAIAAVPPEVTPIKDGVGAVKETDGKAVDGKHALAVHLRSIAPFNKRWQVTETINEGTYGVVFAVRDVETGVHGVIKVAKSVGDDAGNQTAEWEAFILEKIYKENPNASVVRLLDKGVLADQNGDAMQFMVLEKAEIAIFDYLNEFTGTERKLKVTEVSLQLLKGVYDMHREGLLHRDLKPDNMGILNRNEPYVVLFDLGMTRMYTDETGQIRVPRTTCPFRGTPEWASGWAQKGREQNRFDDLVGWLYVCCELYDSSRIPVQPLPWTYRRSNNVLALLKTNHSAAYILLSRAPRQFYTINTYLTTANRNMAPNYRFIADKLKEATQELKLQLKKEKKTGNTSPQKHDNNALNHPEKSAHENEVKPGSEFTGKKVSSVTKETKESHPPQKKESPNDKR